MISKRIIIIGIISMIALAALSALSVYFFEKPEITDMTPKNGQINVPINTREIILTFSTPQEKEILEKTEFNPKIDGSWTATDDRKKYTYKASKDLRALTGYSAKIYTSSRIGKIYTHSLSFKTEFVDFINLPQEQIQEGLDKTDACEKTQNCPY